MNTIKKFTPRIIIEQNPIGQSNLLRKYQNGDNKLKSCASPTGTIMSLIKSKISKPKQLSNQVKPQEKLKLKLNSNLLFGGQGKENLSLLSNLNLASVKSRVQFPRAKNLKSEGSMVVESHLKKPILEDAFKTPVNKPSHNNPIGGCDKRMMSRIGWLFELRTLYDKIIRKSPTGVVQKDQFLFQLKRTTGFLNLIGKQEYRKSKREIGLTVENVEKRLLNISRSELTEDLLIAAVMREELEDDSNKKGRSDSSRLLRVEVENRNNNRDQLYYEDPSENIVVGKQENLNTSDDNTSQHNIVENLTRRKLNNMKIKNSENSSTGQGGSSSNRYFERRRSSSKSDIETARFNKVDGVASSRNYCNQALDQHKKSKVLKTVDFRETVEDLHIRELNDQPNHVPNASPLLNTFSTIRVTEQFECVNNNTSKQQTQSNLLKQLDRKCQISTGVESFEFTHGLESKNMSVSPNLPDFLKNNNSQEWMTQHGQALRLLKDSLTTKDFKTIQKSGDYVRIFSQTEEDNKATSRQSKRSLKNSIGEGVISSQKRTSSKSREALARRVIDNITNILENINRSLCRPDMLKEEKGVLEAINSLHVFEFKNACVLGLDLKSLGDLYKTSDGCLVPSTQFKQLVNNVGILRIHSCIITSRFLTYLTHPNTILLTLTRCNLTSLSILSCMKSLKLLNVSDNLLKSLEGIQNHTSLTELYANNNQLTSLQELKTLKTLKILSLAFNVLTDISELQYLRRNINLANLRLFGNPVCVAKDYSTTINLVLEKVRQIDFFDAEVNDCNQVIRF